MILTTLGGSLESARKRVVELTLLANERGDAEQEALGRLAIMGVEQLAKDMRRPFGGYVRCPACGSTHVRHALGLAECQRCENRGGVGEWQDIEKQRFAELKEGVIATPGPTT